LAASAPREERGVHNPRVVDLIRPGEGGGVELLMLESRPWGSDPLQLAQLEEKLNAYLGYVQTGALVRDYPQIAPYEESMSCAVNVDYARMTTAVSDGDEVAFLPPVSGG